MSYTQPSYRKFVGREYEPPYGCFTLVRQVYEEAYDIELDSSTEGLSVYDLTQRLAYLHGELAKYAREVTIPQEGDVILLRALPFHMGIVIDPKQKLMLHSYAGGSACIESYKLGRWKHRILGFWRYVNDNS